jgi:hypothetical protein
MLKGYRTIIWNLIGGTLAILETTDLSFLPQGWGGYVAILVAIGNLWLRTLTTGPVGTAK